jgi:hypothetical protein
MRGRSKSSRDRRIEPIRRLPLRALDGEFVITAAAIAEAERLLPSFRDPLGDHEGIVFLLGRQLGELTMLTSALAPRAETTRGSVRCSPEQMAEVIEAAREVGLGVLAQLHSHPAEWTEHSVGDDSMVFMPFEGMLSIVAPWYGRVGLCPLANLGVHQYQDGRWVQAEADSIRERITVVPDGIDLR